MFSKILVRPISSISQPLTQLKFISLINRGFYLRLPQRLNVTKWSEKSLQHKHVASSFAFSTTTTPNPTPSATAAPNTPPPPVPKPGALGPAPLSSFLPRFIMKEFKSDRDQSVLVTTPQFVDKLMLVLRYHSYFQFTQCLHISVIDQPGKKFRFTIDYILRSLTYGRVLFVRVQTDEITPVPTISSIFSSATWAEREIWDMYGIIFTNHPDLRRILTDYGFKGHPLRKDFPLTGFTELSYNEATKQLVYEPVEITQDYRNFYFHNPWTSKH